MVKRQTKPLGNVGLHLMHFGAEIFDRLVRFGGGQFGGSAMLIRGANEHHLMAAATRISGIEICGQLTAHQIAEMLNSVDIRNSRSYQNTSHSAPLCVSCAFLPHAKAKGQIEPTSNMQIDYLTRLRRKSRPIRNEVRGSYV